MMTPETPPVPLIRTQADLEQTWRTLMEPLRFGRSSLWLMHIQPDDRPVSQLTEIEDCDGPPDPRLLDNLGGLLTSLQGDAGLHGRWAFLRTRPGRGGTDDVDRAWAEALHTMAGRAGLAVDVVHLATDDTLQPIPLDELNHYGQAS